MPSHERKTLEQALRNRLKRVFDTPIAEAAILGIALGSALEGMRPVVEIMWADFLLVALDELVTKRRTCGSYMTAS